MSISLISICIPAYKNVAFLERLLNSIRQQTYVHYEVIVSDDSPDQSVETFVKSYHGIANLRYFRNQQPLGTPENWNAAIRQARGAWIKIMHDDDWFRGAECLSRFAEAAESGQCDFVYSDFHNVYQSDGREELMVPSRYRMRALKKNAATLLSKNIIGPPSVVMYRNKPELSFDPSLKWLVDIDFYCRYLQNAGFAHCPASLVNIGINKEQVTKQSLRNPRVEIPEHFHLLNKMGADILRNILVYDAFWRLFRNLRIRREVDIRINGYEGPIPAAISGMIGWQRLLSSRLLTVRPVSKLMMVLHYVTHFRRIH